MAQPILVAQMGDYKKGDTGVGSGDHYDLRLARNANGSRGDINPYLNRFLVNGKPLNTYRQTGRYLEQRTKGKHQGVDFGINGSFGGNASARNLYVDPKYPVSNVRAFNDPKGGGWVTQVTFQDGVKVNILHQNKSGVDNVLSNFKATGSSASTATTAQQGYQPISTTDTTATAQQSTQDPYGFNPATYQPPTEYTTQTGSEYDILPKSPAITSAETALNSLSAESLFGGVKSALFRGTSDLFNMVDINGG